MRSTDPTTSTLSAGLAAILLPALLAGALPAQQPERRHGMGPADATKLSVTAESGVPEIPFELINNHMILPLAVNGSDPLDIALDTGMPAPGVVLYGGPAIKSLELDIDPSMRAAVGGAGGDGHRMTAQLAMSESATLPGLAIEDTRIIVLPPLPDFSGYHDGIIGYTLFERFVVELDYDARTMRLLDPESYEVPDGAVVLPITLRGRVPYVTLQLTFESGEPFDAEVVVDLGASHALSLNTDWSDRIRPPERTLETVLGRGLSGPVRGQVGRIPAMGLGSAELRDPLISFPVSGHQNPRGMDSLAGNLGSDVLRRFKTTFDYTGGRLVLEPNEAFDEPFEWDRSGLRFLAADELRVDEVIGDSPAAEVGIEPGDVLTHLNGSPVGGADYGTVRDTLMGEGSVQLRLTRGDETLERRLTLRRLI